jgi:hypothetical protein
MGSDFAAGCHGPLTAARPLGVATTRISS